MKKWQAILLLVLGLIILAAGILCVIQGVWIYKLEYNAQIAEIGYYKEDIHILPYKYQVMQGVTSGFAAMGLLVGVITGGLGIFGIIDNY